MSRYFEWKPYVPVAKRRANALAELARLKKKTGLVAQPVEIAGRTIAASFWGKGWCDHMESFRDYENRLPRGRTYVRNGSVCHLEIKPGRIEAIVSGSELYNVTIGVSPMAKTKWDAVKYSCTGRIGSLIDLLRGKLAGGVMEVVCHPKTGLFPLPGEIKFLCDCPDSALMCKHVAAVLYGVGARLDHAPEKLFLLRGVNHEELVDVSAAVGAVASGGGSRRRLQAPALDELFGIEFAPNERVLGGAAPEKAKPVAKKRGLGAQGAKAAEKEAGVVVVAQGAVAGKSVKPSALPSKRGTKTVAAVIEVASAKRGDLSAPSAKTGAKATGPAAAPLAPAAPPFPKRLTGAVILAWRYSLKETQAEFAARIGVSAGCISQWEKKLRQTLQVRERVLPALHQAWRETHV